VAWLSIRFGKAYEHMPTRDVIHNVLDITNVSSSNPGLGAIVSIIDPQYTHGSQWAPEVFG
jgi:hypothetical protein